MFGIRRKKGRNLEQWQVTLYASFVAQLFSIMGFSASIPFIPLFIIKDLHVPDAAEAGLWSGAMTGISFLTMALTAPVWGVLADRFGRKSMVLRAMLAGCVLTALMSVCGSVQLLMVLRIIQGALTGTVPANVALVASVTPKERRGFALGLMQTAVFTGASIGPLVGGTLADLVDYRFSFVVTSILLGVAGVIVFLFVREGPIVPVPVQAQSDQPKPALRDRVRGFFAQREFMAMLLVLALVQFANNVINPVLALFIQALNGSAKGASSLAGLELGITGITSACAAIVAGRLSDRYGHHRILLICSLGAALLYFPQAAVGNVWELLALRGLMGLFFGGIIPSANAIIAELIPEGRKGMAYGLVTSFTSMGSALGPLVGATISLLAGIRFVFIITGFVLLLDTFWLRRTESAKRQTLERITTNSVIHE
jgi:DHA1 family multidrug resistance protein-like MFS transporter